MARKTSQPKPAAKPAPPRANEPAQLTDAEVRQKLGQLSKAMVDHERRKLADPIYRLLDLLDQLDYAARVARRAGVKPGAVMRAGAQPGIVEKVPITPRQQYFHARKKAIEDWELDIPPKTGDWAHDLLSLRQWCQQRGAGQETIANAVAATSPRQGKGAGPRNALFLEWYEAVDTNTYHKPAKIRDKWNDGMTPIERSVICPGAPNRVAVATVEKGIRRARELRDGPKARKRA